MPSTQTLLARLATAALAIVMATGIDTPSASAQARHPESYRLTRTVQLGAPNAWDYLLYDRPSDRVFVAHGDRLSVVDGHSGRLLGEVGPIPGGPHGIAIDRSAGIGMTDDGRLGQAVLFDLRTLRITQRVPIEPGADAVTFDPVSGHFYVIDGDTGRVAVIDPAAGHVVTSIRLGGDLEFAVPDDHGHLYVNGVTHREIFRIDTRTNRVLASWPIAGCQSPHGLAIDVAAHRLFASCLNQRLVVVDSNDGRLVATLPIGAGSDAVRFDPGRKLIFSSNGFDGTLSVIRELDPDQYAPIDTLKTVDTGRTMTLDRASGRIYIAAARVESRNAWKNWAAAFRAGVRSGPPLVPNSLALLFYDPRH
ncbi:MAG: YncE family protein [Gammaproteobacteria bacterium]|nr:YncE family protein [Gammaproteobacteria bacterium]